MGVFPIVIGALVIVSVTAYALCAIADEMGDYVDPADWGDGDDA